jgi:hypothetical protein
MLPNAHRSQNQPPHAFFGLFDAERLRELN